MDPVGWIIGTGLAVIVLTVPPLVAAAVMLSLVLTRRRGPYTYVVLLLSVIFVMSLALRQETWADGAWGPVVLAVFLYFGYGVIIFGGLATIVKVSCAIVTANAEERGTALALAIFGALLLVVWGAHASFSNVVGSELSAGILAIAWLLALTGMEPIRNRYAHWEKKRLCTKDGHVLEHGSAADGRAFTRCARCSAVLPGESESRTRLQS